MTAFVELFVKDDGLKAGLQRAQRVLSSAAASMAKVGAGLFGAGAAGVGGFGGLMAKAVGSDVEIGRFAAKLGESTESLSAFVYAAETVGRSLQDVEGYFENFQERIAQASQGTGEAAATFRRLGLDARKLQKLGEVDTMLALADAMSGVTDETERLGILSQLGGDKFQELNDLIKSGSAGIREKMAEAGRVGRVVTTEQAEQAKKIDAAWTRVSSAVIGSVLEIGRAFYPQTETIGEFADAVVNTAASVRRFITANRETIQIAVGVAAAVAGAGAALVGLGGAMAAASVAIGGVVSAATAVAAVFAFLATPVGAATAVVVGATAALGYLFATSKEGQAILADLGNYFAETADTVKTSWGGIADALRTGDLALAGRIALAGLEVEFRRAVLALQKIWLDFKEFFVSAWVGAVYLVDREAVKLGSRIGSELLKLRGEDPAKVDAFAKMFERQRLNELSKEFDADAERRRAADRGALDASRAAVDAARAELARLVAQASDAAYESFWDRLKKQQPGGGRVGPGAVVGLATTAGQSGGQGLSQAFAFGRDINKEQLGALLNGNKLAAVANGHLKKIADKPGPRFL